jgi:small conductance mechanosensitive channel
MPDILPSADDLEALIRGAFLPILVILVVSVIVLRFARPLVRRVLTTIIGRSSTGPAPLTDQEVTRRVDTIESLVMSIVRVVVIGLALVLVLAVLNLTPVIAAAAIVIAAFVFAGQDIVKDYLTGAILLAEGEFFVGDVVSIGGVTGTVEEFTLRRTSLRDTEGTVHTVANGEIRLVSNLTRIYSIVNLDLGVAYGTDVGRAMSVVDRVGADLAADPAWAPRLLEPPTAVRVDALADSAVLIKVIGKVRAGEQWAVAGEIRKRVLAAFAAEGIDIPFPTSVVIERQAPV